MAWVVLTFKMKKIEFLPMEKDKYHSEVGFHQELEALMNAVEDGDLSIRDLEVAHVHAKSVVGGDDFLPLTIDAGELIKPDPGLFNLLRKYYEDRLPRADVVAACINQVRGEVVDSMSIGRTLTDKRMDAESGWLLDMIVKDKLYGELILRICIDGKWHQFTFNVTEDLDGREGKAWYRDICDFIQKSMARFDDKSIERFNLSFHEVEPIVKQNSKSDCGTKAIYDTLVEPEMDFGNIDIVDVDLAERTLFLELIEAEIPVLVDESFITSKHKRLYGSLGGFDFQRMNGAWMVKPDKAEIDALFLAFLEQDEDFKFTGISDLPRRMETTQMKVACDMFFITTQDALNRFAVKIQEYMLMTGKKNGEYVHMGLVINRKRPLRKSNKVASLKVVE